MIRRNFLTGMAGILAAGAAPAVLAQGSAMRIWVPKQSLDITMASFVDPFGQRGYVGAMWWKSVMIENSGWMATAQRGFVTGRPDRLTP